MLQMRSAEPMDRRRVTAGKWTVGEQVVGKSKVSAAAVRPICCKLQQRNATKPQVNAIRGDGVYP